MFFKYKTPSRYIYFLKWLHVWAHASFTHISLSQYLFAQIGKTQLHYQFHLLNLILSYWTSLLRDPSILQWVFSCLNESH